MNDEQRAPLQRYDVELGWDGREYATPDGPYLRVADLASEEVGALRWTRVRGNKYVLDSQIFDVVVEYYPYGWGWTHDGNDMRSDLDTAEAAMSDAEQWLIRQCGAFILSAIKGREIIEG